MEIVWLIVAVTVALTATIGVLRAAARSWALLALQLAMLLASAGSCYLIGESKTGGFLAGIVGALCCILLLIAAGGVVLGAAARWFWDWLHPASARPAPVVHWDVWLLGAISALGVVLSAME